MFNSLTLPPYHSLRAYEGKGNWAIDKYYHWPHAFFYRHKLKMVLDLMGKTAYRNILDFGSGPGIFTEELKKHCVSLVSYDLDKKFYIRWKFDLVVCASVLEFVNIRFTLGHINSILHHAGRLIVASPMETKWSKFYFKSIGDANLRHSHTKIMDLLKEQFVIEDYHEWLGLYFAVKVKKK